MLQPTLLSQTTLYSGEVDDGNAEADTSAMPLYKEFIKQSKSSSLPQVAELTPKLAPVSANLES